MALARTQCRELPEPSSNLSYPSHRRSSAFIGGSNKHPMKTEFQTIVIGCGGIGSAALYWLARGIPGEVLGLEQFAIGHSNGSSQDHSRIIRRSYHTPEYTAL